MKSLLAALLSVAALAVVAGQTLPDPADIADGSDVRRPADAANAATDSDRLTRSRDRRSAPASISSPLTSPSSIATDVRSRISARRISR